jgi:3-oxoacyl-[acyl-carrier-protein] synthase II
MRDADAHANPFKHRVAVTGVGLICAAGLCSEEVWNSVLSGKSGINPITHFDARGFSSRIAGEIQGFDPEQYIERKDVKKMGRFIQLAIAATEMALRQSGLRQADHDPERVGVSVGSGIGAFEVIEREHRTFLDKGPGRVSPFFVSSSIINLAAGQISIRTGAKGPNLAPCSACTTSAHAIGEAFRIIQNGHADVMICGGSEACITPLGIAGFAAMRALSTHNHEPHAASRPWDKNRDGFVIGEGGGILVLEQFELASKRRAPILGEIIGYGLTSDAFHISSPPPDGDGAYRAMRNAMRDAGVEPTQIQYLNAHATSTKIGDVTETVAVKRAFGEYAYRLPISSTKSITGHVLGGAGALEAGLTILAVRDQIAPATANLEFAGEGCDLDYIPGKARRTPIRYALSNSFGFGGTNASLVFKGIW